MAVGSLVNEIMSGGTAETFAVGDGATKLMWSDRKAGTIIAVSPSGKEVTWQEDTSTRVDANGMSDAQSYEYAADPNGATEVFSLRKNGRWVTKGQKIGQGSTLGVGRSTYHDYSF